MPNLAMRQEQRNDRVKLLHHRVVARAMKTNPGLLDEARAVVAKWKCESRHATFVDDWERLLARPLSEVRREITRRTPDAYRLRVSSPFPLIPTQVVSTVDMSRLRRLASRPPIAR